MGHRTSHRMVADLLHEMGYSLQANRKTLEGASHPGRNAQFEHINEKSKAFQLEGQPVISVDTKKKEVLGNLKNSCQEWRPKGKPENVKVYDFKDKELGRVSPRGVFDVARNEGWASVGTDHDTAAFAVYSIRRGWESMGHSTYPDAKKLLITADCGGSNGSRVRLWKIDLQKFADEIGIEVHAPNLWSATRSSSISLPPPQPRQDCACAPKSISAKIPRPSRSSPKR
jgi:Rhodopirellula transposase DDE domain